MIQENVMNVIPFVVEAGERLSDWKVPFVEICVTEVEVGECVVFIAFLFVSQSGFVLVGLG